MARRTLVVLPHPTLLARYATIEGKPEFDNQLFDKGAKHYDAIVDWGFLRGGAGYRRWVQKNHGLKIGDHLLDVACGTGLVAVESAKILGPAAAGLSEVKRKSALGLFSEYSGVKT